MRWWEGSAFPTGASACAAFLVAVPERREGMPAADADGASGKAARNRIIAAENRPRIAVVGTRRKPTLAQSERDARRPQRPTAAGL